MSSIAIAYSRQKHVSLLMRLVHSILSVSPFPPRIVIQSINSEHLSRLKKLKHFIDTRTGRTSPQTQIHKEIGKERGKQELDVALYLV